MAGPAGPDPRDLVEAGSPHLEHAIFVLLGMLATIAVIVHVYLVFTG